MDDRYSQLDYIASEKPTYTRNRHNHDAIDDTHDPVQQPCCTVSCSSQPSGHLQVTTLARGFSKSIAIKHVQEKYAVVADGGGYLLIYENLTSAYPSNLFCLQHAQLDLDKPSGCITLLLTETSPCDLLLICESDASFDSWTSHLQHQINCCRTDTSLFDPSRSLDKFEYLYAAMKFFGLLIPPNASKLCRYGLPSLWLFFMTLPFIWYPLIFTKVLSVKVNVNVNLHSSDSPIVVAAILVLVFLAALGLPLAYVLFWRYMNTHKGNFQMLIASFPCKKRYFDTIRRRIKICLIIAWTIAFAAAFSVAGSVAFSPDYEMATSTRYTFFFACIVASVPTSMLVQMVTLLIWITCYLQYYSLESHLRSILDLIHQTSPSSVESKLESDAIQSRISLRVLAISSNLRSASRDWRSMLMLLLAAYLFASVAGIAGSLSLNELSSVPLSCTPFLAALAILLPIASLNARVDEFGRKLIWEVLHMRSRAGMSSGDALQHMFSNNNKPGFEVLSLRLDWRLLARAAYVLGSGLLYIIGRLSVS